MRRVIDFIRRHAPAFAVAALCTPAAVELALARTWQAGLATLGVTLVSLLGVIVLYRYRPTRVLIHIFILVVPIAIFYRVLYHGSISPGVFLSIISTTRREAYELLSAHPWLTGVLLLFVVSAVCAAAASWLAHSPFPRRMYLALAVSAGITLLLWGLVTYHNHGKLYKLSWALRDSAREVFPLDVALSSRIVALGKYRTMQAGAARASFEFTNVHPVAPPSSTPVTYVVVIGESSRRRSWSLYGYPRPTTPRLDAMRDELFVFEDAVTNATVTMYSLALALTRAGPTTWEVAAREKSLVTLLRQGGFRVDWISNQERFGLSENPVTSIALEADSTSFANDAAANLAAGAARDPFDSNLLARLDAVLNAQTQNSVIFLHTMGSHDAYDERYPKSFDVLHSEAAANGRFSAYQLRTIDEYDASVLFTDFIVSSVIKRLAERGGTTAVLYFSDHGERLFEPDLPDLRGHGFPLPSKAEVEVPFLLWLSPALRSSRPEYVTRLRARTAAPVQLENVFDTVVDLAGLSYEQGDTHASLLSADFHAYDSLEVLSIAQRPMCLAAADLQTNKPFHPCYEE
jgi:glucan phosphoethanolaminetransferase (alkaline phosphatase superfamily)